MTDPALIDRPLSTGKHNSPKIGACVIEWLRLHEDLEFSDARLPCQCPVLHSALMRFNDRMPEEPRQRLKLIALKSLGTADDGKQQARAFRLADVACREWAPIAVEARGRAKYAAKLCALDPVVDWASARRANSAAAAADAVYAAEAAAYAAAAADAVYAATVAVAAAAEAAAYAARAAAYAARDADAADAAAVWSRAIEVLEELVA